MKKNSPYLIINIIILLCFFITISCATKPDETELSHNQMLQGLGIVTDLDDLKDPDGNPLPDDYNPLGKKRGVFNPINEIYFTGYYQYANKDQYLVEFRNDPSDGIYGLYTTTDDSWVASSYKNCIGADVDGDGFEEVVIVYFGGSTPNGTLNLKVIDNTNGTYSEYDKVVVSGIESLPILPQYQPGLAKGDLDKDGRDEIIMTFSHYVYVLEDKNNDYAITSRNYSESPDIYVAAGDIDGDAQDEFIVSYHTPSGYAYCDIFDGDLSAPTLIVDYPLLAPNIDNGHQYQHNVHVCMGDIDGDRLDEIVFLGERRDYDAWNVLAMDDARHNLEWLDFFHYSDPSDGVITIGGENQPTLAILDYNGDGLDDIFANKRIFGYKVGSSSAGTNAEMIQNYVFPMDTQVPLNVWAGNVDDDNRDELVLFGYNQFRIGGMNALGNFEYQVQLNVGYNNYSKICLANVDNDTPIIEYTGNHELLFTDPTVIAALACPPYHSGSGQNIGSCGTTFGLSTAQGVEETESTGFSVGFSIGYEYEDPFGISKASFKITVEESLDWISSQSSKIEKYIAYTSGPDEDKVIFTAIPFDVYYYTVISSSDPSEVGEPMTINVPREMQTLSVSRTFYNSKNGDKPDIDNRVMNHTIGNVSSYPSIAERNALLASEGLYSTDSPVGVGSGSITVGIRTTQGQGTGTYSDFSVKVESEVGSGGFTVGASAGFHYGHEYTVTNTESTMYEGTVGDIPDAHYTPDKAYIFGLFTYPIEHQGQAFTVVNYWVE
jgi:hypothetical protein